MLIEVDLKIYSNYFPSNPHPFISPQFIEMNKAKVEKVIRLIDDKNKDSLGLIVGVKNGVIYSPFSAPFGGFHFRNEVLYTSEIDCFLDSLKEYITLQELSGIDLILPPDIYHPTFNAKTVNSLIRSGFQPAIPEITSWVNLTKFNGVFSQRNSQKYYNQAVRNGLSFNLQTNYNEQTGIYDLILKNRAKFGRPIYMTLKDILETGKLWPVDFFSVNNCSGNIVASAICYQNHPHICFPVFWGDNEDGRPLRAMDYLAFSLWIYYKSLGFKYIDLGISTENGHPNEGLLRFKESHEACSSLRYKFAWQV